VGTDGTAYEYPLSAVDFLATSKANRAREQTPGQPEIWTNDHLEILRGRAEVSVLGREGTPASPVAGERAAAAGEEMGEGTEGEGKPQVSKEEDPEYWRKRLEPLRNELAQIEQQIQGLRSGQGRAVSNVIDLNTDAAGVDVADTIRRLERRRTEIQQQIEGIQAEARRLGVPPGYVR